MSDWDVVVVGAGIFGSCTAYHCQKLGLKTLLLEQFSLGHTNGSSHGQSRIIRYAHEEAEYVPVVDSSYQQIEQLEKERGEKLWKKTGLLWMGSNQEVKDIASILNSYNIDHSVIPGKQVHKHYPQFEYDEKWDGLVDPMGGVLFADKWLNAFQDEFKKLGGVILDNTKVISYDSTASRVLLKTSHKVFRSKKAIFTVGSWLQEAFPDVRKMAKVQPHAIAVTYWRPKDMTNMHKFSLDELPVFIMHNRSTSEFLYGLPSVDYPDAIKCCGRESDDLSTIIHEFEKPPQLTQTNKQTMNKFANHSGDEFNIGDKLLPPRKRLIDIPAKHLSEHMKMIESSKPAYVDKCKYTLSSDEHYIIDHHPQKPNVLIGGCGSGSGFKVAPGIGLALAHMAAGKKTPFDVSFFSLKRFENKCKL